MVTGLVHRRLPRLKRVSSPPCADPSRTATPALTDLRTSARPLRRRHASSAIPCRRHASFHSPSSREFSAELLVRNARHLARTASSRVLYSSGHCEPVCLSFCIFVDVLAHHRDASADVRVLRSDLCFSKPLDSARLTLVHLTRSLTLLHLARSLARSPGLTAIIGRTSSTSPPSPLRLLSSPNPLTTSKSLTTPSIPS